MSYKDSTSLVLIGGFGFVGRNILHYLATNASPGLIDPIVIDDLSNAAPGHEGLDLPALHACYNSDTALQFLDALAPRGPEAQPRTFVFLAGETRVAESRHRPLDFIKANISQPAEFVLKALRPGDNFILVSTAGALFDGTFEVKNSSHYCPKNFYGATKAAEEMILSKLVEDRGCQFSVVRMTNVFGRYSEKKKSALHVFARAALEGNEVFVNGDGQQRRDFIFAGDVARGIVTLADRMQRGDRFDAVNTLGSGVSNSLMDAISILNDLTGKQLNYKLVKADDLLKTEPREVKASREDCQKLLPDGITSLRDGMQDVIQYFTHNTAHV